MKLRKLLCFGCFIFTILLSFAQESTNETPPCATPSHQLIQPFLGTWEEFTLDENGNEQFIGTLEVKLGAGGCSLVQRFATPDSTFSYSTMGYVDNGSGYWMERYVFSTGTSAEYQWIVDKGDLVQRLISGDRKIDYLHQLRLTDVTKSGYVVLQERSEDGGRTWIQNETTIVKRK